MKIYKSPREILTVMLLIISALAFLMYTVVNNGMKSKYTSLKNNAILFSNAVSTNLYNFSNERIVFLDEVINENYLSKIKSPFSSGFCDATRSYVQFDDNGRKYVTLTCDNYMLYNFDVQSNEMIVYKISDWKTKKDKNSEQQKMYNCIDSSTSSNVYDDYYEKNFFLYKINSDNGTHYFDVKEIDSSVCDVDTKTFYRTETEIEIKE